MTLTDEILLTHYKQGEARAFRALVERYTSPIYNLALALLHDSMEAENVTQETFLRAVAALDHIRIDQPFKPYLFRIAVNLCYDSLREKKPVLFTDLDENALPADDGYAEIKSENIVDDAPSLAERLEREELHTQLRAAIDALPESYRAAIVLRYVEDFSYEEIAQALNLPLNTVRTHLRRAKQKLKQGLEKGSHSGSMPKDSLQRRGVAPLRPY